MKRSRVSLRCSLLALGLSLALAAPAQAAGAGGLNGVVRDTEGNPLSDLLVALIGQSAYAIPVLTRTDSAGRLLFRNIQAGTYQLLVHSSAYESPARLVEILPGRTLSVSLVLQQLLSLGPADQQNVGIKTLLRSGEGRMIFRTAPEPTLDSEGSNPFFEKAAVEVYASAGAGGDAVLSPLDFPGGTTTNFAVKRSLVGGNDYIVAGQFNSGPDSYWRVKNLLNYELSDSHSLQFFVGYGRISLQEPSPAALQNLAEPMGGYIPGTGGARIISMGFEDSLQFGDTLSLLWGLELDQVRRNQSQYFVSPSAEVRFAPLRGTTLRLMMASKRETQGDAVGLPQENSVNLNDAVYFSLIDDHLSMATGRHYEASLEQQLGQDASLEVAAYRDQFSEAAVPYFLISDRRSVNAFRLSGEQAGGEGYRVTYRQRLSDNFKAAVSYIRGDGTGLESGEPAVLVDQAALTTLLRRKGYHAIATEIEAFVPLSQTHVTAVVKRVSGGGPLTSLNAYSDVFETSNQGVNLFVRQLVPVPTSLLNFLGLDFLAAYRIEALLDVRNLTNDNLGVIRSGDGSLLLVHNPRTVRGGIALNF